jgi:hypothetical protein
MENVVVLLIISVNVIMDLKVLTALNLFVKHYVLKMSTVMLVVKIQPASANQDGQDLIVLLNYVRLTVLVMEYVRMETVYATMDMEEIVVQLKNVLRIAVKMEYVRMEYVNALKGS